MTNDNKKPPTEFWFTGGMLGQEFVLYADMYKTREEAEAALAKSARVVPEVVLAMRNDRVVGPYVLADRLDALMSLAIEGWTMARDLAEDRCAEKSLERAIEALVELDRLRSAAR